MATKKILGLDLGTNSIGWAVVNKNDEKKSISHAGSRIIPMDAALQGDFESGNSISQTANRTAARGVRRLFERRALRRERLNRVLNLMSFLPEHYTKHLNRYGQLNKGQEPKLAWCPDENGKMHFLFQSSFDEMVKEFAILHPDLLTDGKKNVGNPLEIDCTMCGKHITFRGEDFLHISADNQATYGKMEQLSIE